MYFPRQTLLPGYGPVHEWRKAERKDWYTDW